ncbi:MAG: 30S ribosomal protein S8 [Deltaproteobacteria bacterium]|nr:MAG: 30S ribosomal protein S8 [Deltaproteobacteria bacterium]
MTDPIADLLTRIRNAVQARHSSLMVPRSKLKLEVVKILKREGFVEGYIEVDEGPQGWIKIFPRYDESNKAVIRGLQRVSKPSRRRYVGKDDIPRVRNGLGVAILTTPRGLLTDRQARQAGVGGEVLCYVW